MFKKTMATIISGFLVLSMLGTAYGLSISTSFNSNNGSSGNMFNLTNVSAGDVTLTGMFEGNFAANSVTVEMWYRPGSYVGFENSSAGWTLLGTDTIAPLGVDIPAPFDVGNSLTLGAGEQIGLFMYSNSGSDVEYTNGANTFTDGFLTIETGIGKGFAGADSFGGSVFSPRTWNGTIEYTAGQSSDPVPEPTTLLLFGTGLVSLIGYRRMKKNK